MTLVLYAVPEDSYYDHRLGFNKDQFSWNTGTGINIKQEIREALTNAERDYVLHVAAEFEELIQGRGVHVKSTTFTAYQRFLVYCCSVYYNLAFGVDYVTLEIFIVRTPASQIPPLRIADLLLAPLQPTALSEANLLLSHLPSHLKNPKPITPGPTATPTIQIGPYTEQMMMVQPGIVYQAPVNGPHGFLKAAPNQTPSIGAGGDSSIPIVPPVQILRRNGATTSESGGSRQSSPPVTQPPTPVVGLIQPPVVAQAPGKRGLTLAEREAAYQEARRRIFASYREEEALTDDDGTSDTRSSSGETDALRPPEMKATSGNGVKGNTVDPTNPARSSTKKTVRFQPASEADRITRGSQSFGILLPSDSSEERNMPGNPTNAVRSTTKQVRFMPATDRSRIIRWGEHISTPISAPMAPLTPTGTILLYDEDLESETASLSGAGSIYSHASSRTRSTDYGLHYRSRALSEEDVKGLVGSGFWAKLST